MQKQFFFFLRNSQEHFYSQGFDYSEKKKRTKEGRKEEGGKEEKTGEGRREEEKRKEKTCPKKVELFFSKSVVRGSGC